MANVDNPMGATPARHAYGGRIIAHKYLSTSATDIFIGDFVKMDSDGDVLTITATTDGILGVAATFATADQDEVWIYDDPGIVFSIQASGTINQVGQGELGPVTIATGNTTTLRSIHEMGAAGGSGEDQLRIIDKVDTPGNDWGTNVQLLVEIHDHRRTRYYNTTAGV